MRRGIATACIATLICIAVASAQRLPTQQAPPQLRLAEREVPIIILGNPGWWDRLEAARLAPQQRIGAASSDTDADGDGFQSTYAGGNDCNDNDRQTYPGNNERADEVGHDEDCNLATIARSGSESATHDDGDADADGFISYRVFNFARHPSGEIYAIVRGPDCNDSVRSINPIASEIPGDGVDNNCNDQIDEPLPPEARSNYVRPVEGLGRPSQAPRR
jgi:hypothetical protein